MLDKDWHFSNNKNTANDYVFVIQQWAGTGKGNAAVVSSKSYKEGNDAVVEFTYSGDRNM